MEKLFRLSVVTPEASVFEADVSYVNLPTPYGSLGIMANHAPMLCALERGRLRCTDGNGQTLRIRISGGVASVDHNELTVLTQAAEAETE